MFIQETDLNKIFAELDRSDVDVFVSRNRTLNNSRWSISLALENENHRDAISVSGDGDSMREALAVAFNRLGELANLLEWKPEEEK